MIHRECAPTVQAPRFSPSDLLWVEQAGASAEPKYLSLWDFPGGASGKEPACQRRLDIGDLGSLPGSGRSPGGEYGNPLQCSCLENPGDEGAWWAAVCGVAQSQTRLRRLSSSKQA